MDHDGCKCWELKQVNFSLSYPFTYPSNEKAKSFKSTESNKLHHYWVTESLESFFKTRAGIVRKTFHFSVYRTSDHSLQRNNTLSPLGAQRHATSLRLVLPSMTWLGTKWSFPCSAYQPMKIFTLAEPLYFMSFFYLNFNNI